jgi:hypothetical protein
MAPSVQAWLASCNRLQPLPERTVLELARRIRSWQGHPGGPEHAPEPMRRRAIRARDQLVRHNLRLISHTWNRHRSSLPPSDEGTADAVSRHRKLDQRSVFDVARQLRPGVPVYIRCLCFQAA